jgi:hypothetical protein
MNEVKLEAQHRTDIKHQLRMLGATGWKNNDSTELLENALKKHKAKIKKILGIKK